MRQAERNVIPQTDTAADEDSVCSTAEEQTQTITQASEPEKPNKPMPPVQTAQSQSVDLPTQAKPTKRKPTLYESAKPPVDF